jgi:hypothetical protein
MTASSRVRSQRGAIVAAMVAFVVGPASAQILPWEIVVAEIETGRVRNLAQRLNKQYLLYTLRLGDVTKSDLGETAAQMDGVLDALRKGSPSRSIPEPWTAEIRARLAAVEDLWGPVRRIAVASPYEHIRVLQEFSPPQSRSGDPLLLRYYDDLTLQLVTASDQLLAAYHEECVKTGLEVCATARTSGYAAMIIERAAKEAVGIVAGIRPEENRKRLKATIADYLQVRDANNTNPFFEAALDPKRGISAQAAGELLLSLRQDWDAMQLEFTILSAGDEKNFELERLIATQERLVAKVERLTAALIRYASLRYGS